AEIGAVSNVTVRLKELRVVEEIEELGAKLDALTFRNGRVLMQRKVPTTNARPAADGTFSVSKGTQRNSVICEQGRIEPVAAVFARILRLQRARLIGLTRKLEIEAIHFFDVILRSDAYGEPTLYGHNTRQVPTIGNLARKSTVSGRGQVPNVAEHETMPGVELCQRAAATRIQRIQDGIKAGGVIKRLAPRKCDPELQPMRHALFERGLQRVIGGVSNRIMRENAGEHRIAVARTAVGPNLVRRIPAADRVTLRRRILSEADQSDGSGVGSCDRRHRAIR